MSIRRRERPPWLPGAVRLSERVLLALLLLAWLAAPIARAEPAGQIVVEVVTILEGDTMLVIMPDGTDEPVRLIGVRSWSSALPNESFWCYGVETFRRTTELALGRAVRLELDVAQRDEEGWLLAYVWVDDLMLNARLAAEGYAVPTFSAPNVRYAADLVGAGAAARDQGLGLWSTCSAVDIPSEVAPTEHSEVAPTEHSILAEPADVPELPISHGDLESEGHGSGRLCLTEVHAFGQPPTSTESERTHCVAVGPARR